MSNPLRGLTRNQRDLQGAQLLIYNTQVQRQITEQQQLIYELLQKIAAKVGIENENENNDTQTPPSALPAREP